MLKDLDVVKPKIRTIIFGVSAYDDVPEQKNQNTPSFFRSSTHAFRRCFARSRAILVAWMIVTSVAAQPARKGIAEGGDARMPRHVTVPRRAPRQRSPTAVR